MSHWSNEPWVQEAEGVWRAAVAFDTADGMMKIFAGTVFVATGKPKCCLRDGTVVDETVLFAKRAVLEDVKLRHRD